MASLPFRAQGFQKDNLSCVIMSICDLGQALVMHECIYRHAQGPHAAHRTTVSEEIQSTLLWAPLLLLTGTKLCVQSGYQNAYSYHSSLSAAMHGTHVC